MHAVPYAVPHLVSSGGGAVVATSSVNSANGDVQKVAINGGLMLS